LCPGFVKEVNTCVYRPIAYKLWYLHLCVYTQLSWGNI